MDVRRVRQGTVALFEDHPEFVFDREFSDAGQGCAFVNHSRGVFFIVSVRCIRSSRCQSCHCHHLFIKLTFNDFGEVIKWPK